MPSQDINETKQSSAHSSAEFEGGAAVGRQISIQLTPEQFEKLYLQPGGVGAKGDLSQRLGNPTPLGLVGLVMTLTPLSCYLMGWGGTTLAGATAINPFLWYFGVILLGLGGIFEIIVGNTYPATVFLSFGAFLAAFGDTYGEGMAVIGAAYPEGAQSLEFNHSLAIWFCWFAVLTLAFLIASLRTNLVFVLLFTFLDITFCMIAAIYFYVGSGQFARVPALQTACGAFAFLTTLCGWYLLYAILFLSTGMPIALPLGDLSGAFKRKRSLA